MHSGPENGDLPPGQKRCPVCQAPDIHHKILGLDESEINEDYYKYLLEKNTADEMRIRSLLLEKELVEETLQVLEEMDPAD